MSDWHNTVTKDKIICNDIPHVITLQFTIVNILVTKKLFCMVVNLFYKRDKSLDLYIFLVDTRMPQLTLLIQLV